MKTKIKIALVQFSTPQGPLLKNFESLKAQLKKISSSVDCVVLPEMWLSSFETENATSLWRETQSVWGELKRYAHQHKTYLIGSLLEKAKEGYYNTASVLGPSGVLGKYRKIHLFQGGGEERKFQAGKKAVVLNTPFGKIGLAICYDIRFPELIRKEVLLGARILFIPSAWPKERIDHYLTLLKARAIENLCFVVSVNKTGKHPSGFEYGGHSVVYDPWGRTLGEMGENAGVLEVTLDLKSVDRIRKSFPVFEARREDVY